MGCCVTRKGSALPLVSCNTEAWEWQQRGERLWPNTVSPNEWHLDCGWGADGLQRFTSPAPRAARNVCRDVTPLESRDRHQNSAGPDTICMSAGWRASGRIWIPQTSVSHVATPRPRQQGPCLFCEVRAMTNSRAKHGAVKRTQIHRSEISARPFSQRRDWFSSVQQFFCSWTDNQFIHNVFIWRVHWKTRRSNSVSLCSKRWTYWIKPLKMKSGCSQRGEKCFWKVKKLSINICIELTPL